MSMPLYDIISYVLTLPPVFSDPSEKEIDKSFIFSALKNDKHHLYTSEKIMSLIFNDNFIPPSRIWAEGLFNNDKTLLVGNRVQSDGTKEGGYFEEGVLSQGTRFLPNKTVEKGRFLHNRLVEGERIYKNGMEERGSFKKFLKKGIRIFSDGNYEKGHFYNNELISGEKYNHNGLSEEGQFNTSGLHGAGSVTNAITGATETGIFELGILIRGIKNNAEGCIETGNFNKGELTGLGKRCCPNKSTEQGFFIKGQLKHKGLKTVMLRLYKCWKRIF